MSKNGNNLNPENHYISNTLAATLVLPERSLTTEKTAESENVMTVREVAKFLKCSTKKIYKLCKDGIIPCKRLGDGSYRFWKPEIEKWLKGESYE